VISSPVDASHILATLAKFSSDTLAIQRPSGLYATLSTHFRFVSISSMLMPLSLARTVTIPSLYDPVTNREASGLKATQFT
jgi:hypothetical protein